MRERPILFSTEMVRAILEDRKNQTRRVVTPHTSQLDWGTRATWKLFDWASAFVDPGPSPAGNPGPYLKVYEKLKDRLMHRIYPRIHPGDLLYVREAVSSLDNHFGGLSAAYKADGDFVVTPSGSLVNPWWKDYTTRDCPSIHMPKKFARIWLRVTDVRVERLQDITESDAEAEGCPGAFFPADVEFQCLWDSINAKRGYGWDTDPWVWVIEFERAER